MIICVPTNLDKEPIKSISEPNNKYKRADHEGTSCH